MNAIAMACLKENFSAADIKKHGEEILQQLMWMIQDNQVKFIPCEPRFIPKTIVLHGICHIDYLRSQPKETSFGWQEIVVNTTPGKFFLKTIDRQWFREVHIEITIKEIKNGVQASDSRRQARPQLQCEV